MGTGTGGGGVRPRRVYVRVRVRVCEGKGGGGSSHPTLASCRLECGVGCLCVSPLALLQLKRQVLLSAAEAAEMVLRVDDIVRCAPRKRQEDHGH